MPATAAEAIKVCVVEDDDWIRKNLEEHINKTEGLQCLKTYRTAEEAIVGIPHEHPEVVLMDINLPKMNGIDCVRELKSLQPGLEIIMLTAYEDSNRIFDSLLAGASGYLQKSTPQSEIFRAIIQVRQGGSPMNVDIARKVVQYFNKAGQHTGDLEKLTPREKQILDYLARGASYKEIADALSISFDTVSLHTKGIYRKLHVHSRSEAVSKYFRRQ
jgi:DNA-binding NarL/FixJ family response regulator